MKFLVVLSVLALCACSVAPTYYARQTWATEQFEQAKAVCIDQIKEHDRMQWGGDDFVGDVLAFNDRFASCLSAHGFKRVNG